MTLAQAITIMQLAEDTGSIGLHPEDPTCRWLDAWRYFKRRPDLRRRLEEGAFKPVAKATPQLDDIRPYMSELVAVFNVLNRWYEEPRREPA